MSASGKQHYFQLGLKLSDDSFKAAVLTKQSPELTQLLGEHLQDHGLLSTLSLLDNICEEKTQAGKRFNSIAPWPRDRTSDCLHLLPNLGTESPNPLANTQPVTLRDVMDPSFALTLDPKSTREIQGRPVSNAELLITDLSTLKQQIQGLPEIQQADILKDKKNIDSYYRHRGTFLIVLEGKAFMITVPTTRYAPPQFLAMSVTGRVDIQKTAAESQKTQFNKSVEAFGGSKSKTVTSDPSSTLPPEAVQRIGKKSAQADNPGLMRRNNADIGSMAALIAQLPPGSFIGQNSLDTSSDETCEHLQVFLEAPITLIPLFTAPAIQNVVLNYTNADKKAQSIEYAKVCDFPGSIYRITTSSNDQTSRFLLEEVQEGFIKRNTGGSSMNLISRKVSDTQYEHYFVLRKSIKDHPELQSAPKEKGSNRPGWFEMIGVRIGKTAQEFITLPDDRYRTEIVKTFTADQQDCQLFEGLMH